ncbi:b253457d-76b6-4d6f-bb50-a511773bb79e [Thermothielavioides terrestris]|nr:b253457d-76b6-4d6f-bb50-a511773bb79e [Thermothielavioides terrestris]
MEPTARPGPGPAPGDDHHSPPQEDPDIVPARPRDEHDDDEFPVTDGYKTASPTGSTSVTSSIYAHRHRRCGEVLCDDGTMLEDDSVKHLYEVARQAFSQIGMNCIVKKVLIGPWAVDKTVRVVGMYQQVAVQDLMSSLAAGLFAALGMS